MEFRVLNQNPLYDYHEACKITQGIKIDKDTFKPKDEVTFWIKQIVANHSTIRCIKFRIIAEAPRSVIMQIIRATKGHPQPYVQSSRPDWNNGKERSANPYEEKMFIQDHTAESWIEMCKQRLCNRTEERTQKFVSNAVKQLINSNNPFLVAVGICSQPACWWLKSCPEIKSCSKSEKTSDVIIKARDILLKKL